MYAPVCVYLLLLLLYVCACVYTRVVDALFLAGCICAGGLYMQLAAQDGRGMLLQKYIFMEAGLGNQMM